MSDHTKIEWADATVNAINGCSVLSPGCTNCYAMASGRRNLPNHPSTGLTKLVNGNHVWTGEVRLTEKALLQPLRWKAPRRIFWNAHGDLFHEAVPDRWIDQVFAVCALTPQHQHLILTKRSARMREYCISRFGGWGEMYLADAIEAMDGFETDCGGEWGEPLPNVWLGVSVEDQTRADQRIPDLLATPAAVRFISAEPLLGPVDLRAFGLDVHHHPDNQAGAALAAITKAARKHIAPTGAIIDWVIVGGESGPGARPMHPDWARRLRDQCTAAGLPFFFKQWGEWLPCETDNASDGTGTICYPDDGSERSDIIRQGTRRPITNLPGQDFWRVGKAKAGRLLDGVEHSEFPA